MVELDKPLTTRIIPHQFLKHVFLVGHVPQRALASDPRLSYSLYIPQEHYPKDPEQKLPLLVHVHGTSRDLSPVRRELVAFADSMPCAILAPLFPANLDGPNDFNSYKDLRTSSLRSDLALISMLDEVAYTWPGIETTKIHLMGFSAGGQFAHRFLYLYPERLSSISVGSPGQSTALDYQQNWPKGVADIESIFDKKIQEDLIKDVTIQLVIGANDVSGHGSPEFRQWVRKVTTLEGKEATKSTQADISDTSLEVGSRVDTIRKLQASWKQLGIESRLDIVEGVAHKSAGVRDVVLAFFGPILKKQSVSA
jgi:pimeloyl-ACP methyl ester carboxylesterase